MSFSITERFSTVLKGDSLRSRIEAETVFVVFSLFFYTNPILGNVLGSRQSTSIFQVIYTLVYAVTCFAIYKNRKYLSPVIQKGGLLWVIVFLPLVSTMWSPFPDVTLRRAFALVNTSLFGVYLGARYNLKEILYLLRAVFLIILVLSLVFGLVFPSWGLMQETHAGAFRGIFIHKNSAAIRLSTGVLVFLVLAISNEKQKLLNFSGLILAFGMVCMTQSSTGLITCLASFATIPFLFIPRGKLIHILPALFAMMLGVLACTIFVFHNYHSLLAVFGEDGDLTGRTTFFPVIIESIFQKFWFGYGYQGYWAGGLKGPSAILAQLATTGTKFHAHNGFLEMMLSVGFIGISCFLFNLWSSILNILKKLRTTQGFLALFPMLFMVQFFAVNMVETAMYNFNNMTWILYMAIVTIAAKWGAQTPSLSSPPIKTTTS